MSEPIDAVADLQSFVGNTVSATGEITPDLVERFCATLDIDHEALPGRAPLGIHFCIAPTVVATAALREDGHPAKSDFLPAPLPRRMWAGGQLTFLKPLQVGQIIERRSRIADVRMKSGRSGRLCFVTVMHDILADGQPAIEEQQDIVYREIHGTNSAPASAPAKTGAFRKNMVPSSPLLFRYSALTFNSHRIHYDRNYAVDVEGYPGLVIHGPLQATLLMQFGADLRGEAMRKFSFRSGAPIFDTQPFHLNAETVDDGLSLWTSAVDGPAAMTAIAEW